MNSPLNILMITHMKKFGSSVRSHAMARQLVLHGHRVSLMLISRTRRFGIVEYDWDGVHIIETPDLLWGRMRSGWDLWDAFNRIYYLNKTKESYDLIHCFETRPTTIYPALFLSRKRSIPMITDWNDWWGHQGLIEVNRPNWYRFTLFNFVETYFEEAFRVNAAGLTVIATALRQRAVELGVNPERICHIPGGTFPDIFLLRSKAEARSYANLPLDSPILGFGSYSHLDMNIIMESLKIVAQKYPGVNLIITGKVKSSIQKMVKKHGLENHVIFLGFLSMTDYPIYLSCADVFLLPMQDRPYNHGRWPNKMGEYLSLGRPTVSNPVGDIKSLFEKHQVGFLAKWSPQDFAEKIIDLLDHPDIADEFAKNARWVAENEYNWSFLGNQLEVFYYKILELEADKNKVT